MKITIIRKAEKKTAVAACPWVVEAMIPAPKR